MLYLYVRYSIFYNEKKKKFPRKNSFQSYIMCLPTL